MNNITSFGCYDPTWNVFRGKYQYIRNFLSTFLYFGILVFLTIILFTMDVSAQRQMSGINICPEIYEARDCGLRGENFESRKIRVIQLCKETHKNVQLFRIELAKDRKSVGRERV